MGTPPIFFHPLCAFTRQLRSQCSLVYTFQHHHKSFSHKGLPVEATFPARIIRKIPCFTYDNRSLSDQSIYLTVTEVGLCHLGLE